MTSTKGTVQVSVKIYLNDGEDHFFGFENSFANNPELTMVHSFDAPFVCGQEIMNRSWMNNLLEVVFEQTNQPVTTELWAIEYRNKMLRSVSVGDCVTIGETAFSCESVGWKLISTEDLSNAIIWDDEVESVR